MNNIISIQDFKRSKSLKKTINEAELLMSDIAVTLNILTKYKDFSMMRSVINELQIKHDEVFRFIIKKNNELKSIEEKLDG